MRISKFVSIILTVSLASAGLTSCSCDHPEIIHLDFADDVSVVGPSMGEKAAGHFKIDSSIRRCELDFLVNESKPACYAEPVIDRFLDTSQLIRDQIAKRYYELRVHFYHRSGHTDEMLEARTSKALVLCYNDDISEYVWRDGRPSDTVFYDEHGRVKGGGDIQLEDMRKKHKP